MTYRFPRSLAAPVYSMMIPNRWPLPFLAALLLTLPAVPHAHAQQAAAEPESLEFRLGSFEVWVFTYYFTRENRSSAVVMPRGSTGTRHDPAPGGLMWNCARGGGVNVGVALPVAAEGGKSRRAEWRFDGDAPAAGVLLGIAGYRRWYLAPDHVARFSLRARTARSLTIRLPDDGTEYAYDLEQPGEALDQLVCARGTPVSGLLPQPDETFSGVGGEEAAAQGTYDILPHTPPRIADEAQFAEAVAQSIPRRLRRAGISGTVILRFRVRRNGSVDPESVRVRWTTHEEMNAPMIRLARLLVLTPAMRGGEATEGWITLPIRFSAPPPASRAP